MTSCQQNLTISLWLGGGGGGVHSDHHELTDSPKTVCQNDQFLGQKMINCDDGSHIQVLYCVQM